MSFSSLLASLARRQAARTKSWRYSLVFHSPTCQMGSSVSACILWSRTKSLWHQEFTVEDLVKKGLPNPSLWHALLNCNIICPDCHTHVAACVDYDCLVLTPLPRLVFWRLLSTVHHCWVPSRLLLFLLLLSLWCCCCYCSVHPNSILKRFSATLGGTLSVIFLIISVFIQEGQGELSG